MTAYAAPRAAGVLLMALVFSTEPRTSSCHPQCLDFRPPFESAGRLFCSEYEDFGCCDVARDGAVRTRYEAILNAVGNDANVDQRRCRALLKSVLCQECSPYAAHVYDAEDDRVRRPFPGLCPGYCAEFYAKCRKLIPLVADDPGVVGSMTSSDLFCSNLTLTDVDYCYPDWTSKAALNRSLSRAARTEEGCLCLEPFAPDERLRNALSFRQAPDGSGRIFVSEQLGAVHVYYKNGSRIRQPFLDISDVVLSSSSPGDERGFLNLAFHPDFAANGRFYVYMSVSDAASGRQRVRISELRVRNDDGNRANTSSERVILEVDQPFWNHNGGELFFGVDRYLYAFFGDGGAGGDPQGNAQNKGTLLGSAVRLDVDDYTDSRPYAIPGDNPFVAENGSRPEIYAYGIRNIWRCDVDEGHPETGYGYGRIFCGDVGQGAYEEIDIIKKGGNYGWNSREGFQCYRQELCGKIGPEELPIYAYPHSVGKSVIGGHVYRGCLNPNLQGFYIYGDYNNGKLFRLKEDIDPESGASSWENRELSMCGDDVCFNGLVGEYEKNILSFGEDDDGEIYILTTNYPSSTYFGGKIYKLVDPRRRGDPTKCRSYVTTQSTTVASTVDDREEGPPLPPTIVQVSLNAADNRAVDVTWSYSHDGRRSLLYYVLQYRATTEDGSMSPDDGWRDLEYTIPRSRLTYTVGDLEPLRGYQFRIAAANPAGMGAFSVPSRTIRLTQKPPSGPPTDVVAYGYLHNNIVVRWSPPLDRFWNGPLFGYVVRYRPVVPPDAARRTKIIYSFRITAEILTELERLSQYEVSVAAYNAAGIGAYSAVLRVWTSEGVPTVAPSDVAVAASSPTSVRATWSPPGAQSVPGTLRGYVLRAYRVNATAAEATARIPVERPDWSGRREGHLNGLRKYADYDITVSCYTSKGEGPQSEPVRERTLQDVPDPVSRLRFSNIQMHSFQVVWGPPVQSNGILTGYALVYEEDNRPVSRVMKWFPPDVLNYTAESLAAGRLYSVQVSASTVVGRGKTRKAFVHTVSPSPGYLEVCDLGSPFSSRTLACGPGLTIQKLSASYGRMKEGECIRDKLGSIGCSFDVSAVIRQFCGGKRKCILHDWFLMNRIMIPEHDVACPPDLPKYLEVTYRCENDPCNSGPCQNGGLCTASEDPYNLGYFCSCLRNYGGRHCQIVDPCRTNPCSSKKTQSCIRVMFDDVTGRVCYNRKWQIVDSDGVHPL